MFQAAPPDWFYNKGISTPVWCPACRKWRDAQVDEALHCTECRELIRLSRKYKISMHKNKGPFTRPEKCKLCETGRRKRMAVRVARREPKKPGKDTVLEELMDLTDPPTPVLISTQVADYQFPVGKRDDRHTRQEHLERHISGHANSRTDKSPTSLVAPGTDFATQLQAISEIALSEDGSRVRQFSQGQNTIVKLSLRGDMIEKTVIDTVNKRVITSYDGIPLSTIIGELGDQSR